MISRFRLEVVDIEFMQHLFVIHILVAVYGITNIAKVYEIFGTYWV